MVIFKSNVFHDYQRKNVVSIKGNIQKQPLGGVLKKSYSENMQQIYRKQHLCQSVISIKLQRNFIEITLCHGCFPVNLLHIFRIPFLKNTSGWLLLNIFFYGNNISLSDCNWTRTHNHLVHKRIMASLAKWLNVRL